MKINLRNANFAFILSRPMFVILCGYENKTEKKLTACRQINNKSHCLIRLKGAPYCEFSNHLYILYTGTITDNPLITAKPSKKSLFMATHREPVIFLIKTNLLSSNYEDKGRTLGKAQWCLKTRLI